MFSCIYMQGWLHDVEYYIDHKVYSIVDNWIIHDIEI